MGSRRPRYDRVDFDALVQHSADVILITDIDSTVRFVSRPVFRVLGYDADVILGTVLTDLLHPDDVHDALAFLASAAGDQINSHRSTWRVRHANGEWRNMEIAAAHLIEDPTVGGIVLNARDITAEERVVEALRAGEARYRMLFDASPQPMWVYDLETLKFLAVNAAAVTQYGYTREQFLEMTLLDIRPAEDESLVRTQVSAIAADPDGVAASSEWRHCTKAGKVLTVAVSSHPLMFDGRGARLVLAADITARKTLEAKLSYQAFHDPLTELANRALFRSRVERALEHVSPHDHVAVIFLDLDDFKTVNDSLGHGAGDRLLVVVAQRLLNATRGCDTVARLGGDEFAVLLQNVRTEADAITVTDRITASMHTPVPLDGAQVTIGASIGIARAGEADGAEELLRNADLAMYKAKQAGKGRCELFEPAMHAAVVERLAAEADLRRAMDQLPSESEFHLVYQPILDLSDATVVGVEALLRWTHPRHGVVQPAEFIPTAEATGLIVGLGQWVIREACRQGAAWQALRPSGAPLTVTVNISGRQLQDASLLSDVGNALAESGLVPACLVLEITESVIMQRTDETLSILQGLKSLGVQLAIDDFGTGYSSLAYLQRFPMDILKIDKSFVDGVALGGNDAALTRTIIALGEMLSLRCVAEGIETAEQGERLKALGCALGQGFYFYPPIEASAITVLLQCANVLPRDTSTAPTPTPTPAAIRRAQRGDECRTCHPLHHEHRDTGAKHNYGRDAHDRTA